MAYARVQDMVDRFGERELVQLSDRDDVGQLNNAVLMRALNDAMAFADGYLGRVYKLPLPGCAKPPATVGGLPEFAPPPVLTRMVCDVARYYLYTELADEHQAARRYKAAQKDFLDIAKGQMQLSCPWGGAPGEALGDDALAADEVQHSFAPRALDADTLRGFA